MSEAALSASLEDYLEAIYMIVLKKQAARAKDIADRLKVHRSSVTNALRALKARALVNYAPYDLITLTDKGRALGADIRRRHEVLRDFFVKVLALEDRLAETTACQMEHSVSEEVLERFIRFVDYVEACPRGGAQWVKGFKEYCTDTCTFEECEACLEGCLEDLRKEKAQRKSLSAKTCTTLDALRPGQKARITKIRSTGVFASRLRTMGVTPGTLVEVERVAPFGDPVDIKIRGYHLSLRKEDLQGIAIEELAGEAGE